jgi:hypothetical protein
MPNRILKESITTSESLSKLTAEEERHFHRCLVLADDFGCLQMHSMVVRAKAYSRMLDTVTTDNVDVWNKALASHGLIHLYEADGELYGHFVKWSKHQTIRAKRSKHPTPPCEYNCDHLQAAACNGKQMQAHVSVIQSNTIHSESFNPSLSPQGENNQPKNKTKTKAKRTTRTPMTADQDKKLMDTFLPSVGGNEVLLREWIEEAKDHKASTKWSSEYLGLRNWLRNNADRFANRPYQKPLTNSRNSSAGKPLPTKDKYEEDRKDYAS